MSINNSPDDNSLRRLSGSRHRETGHVFFPEIPETFPIANEYEALTLSMQAEIYSFTVVHPSPKSGQPPFAIAYADFPEGVRVMGRLVSEAPAVGMPVTVEVEDAAEGQAPAYRFVPRP